MGQVAAALDALTITVTSPDGNLKLCFRDDRPSALAFRGNAYFGYEPATLQLQLAKTTALAHTRYQQGTRDIVERAGLSVVTDPGKARDLAHRRYLEGVRDLTAIGMTKRELVVFRATGAGEWRCRIDPDALLRLDQARFSTEVIGAARAALRRLAFEKAMLKNSCFGTRSTGRRGRPVRPVSG